MSQTDERRTTLLLYLIPTALLLGMGCFGCVVRAIGWLFTRAQIEERREEERRQQPSRAGGSDGGMIRFGLAMLVYLMLAAAIQTRIMLAAWNVPLDYPMGGLSFWALAFLGFGVWRWTYPPDLTYHRK